MKTLRDLGRQLLQLWRKADLRSRVVFSVAIGLSLAATIAVGIWSSRPEFVPLARDLTAEQASRVKGQLDAAGIANKLNFDASTVLVPKSKWNVARLAVKDDLGDLPTAPPDVDASPWSDPRTIHMRLLRQQEAHLAQTIASWHGVAEAKVHLAKPEPSVFVRQQAPVTASVVLRLRPGVPFSPDQATTIAAMVAGAVEGLDPQHVTVMDTEGRVLSTGGQGLNAVSQQLAYKRELEADLAAKAQSMLAGMLGPGRALVRVVADLDFTSTVRTDTQYDPDKKVRTKETSVSWQSTGASTIALGPAGTASNFSATGSNNSAPTGPSTSKGEQIMTEFQNGVSESRIEEAPGRLKRLTVAATVDLSGLSVNESAGATGTGNAATPGTGQISKADIENLIKSTVGFDESRGDGFSLVNAPLLGTGQTQRDLQVLHRWQFYRDLARNISLGVAALAALLLGLLILRRLRPVTVSAVVEDPARLQTLSALSQRVRDDPDTVKAVIQAWLGETGKPSGSATPRKAA